MSGSLSFRTRRRTHVTPAPGKMSVACGVHRVAAARACMAEHANRAGHVSLPLCAFSVSRVRDGANRDRPSNERSLRPSIGKERKKKTDRVSGVTRFTGRCLRR